MDRELGGSSSPAVDPAALSVAELLGELRTRGFLTPEDFEIPRKNRYYPSDLGRYVFSASTWKRAIAEGHVRALASAPTGPKAIPYREVLRYFLEHQEMFIGRN